MKNDVNENKSENNNYLLKSIYLIRINFPSSEYLYIIMYILKYLGYIIWSMYLTQNLKNEQEEKESKGSLLITFLSTFLINGKNLSILKTAYEDICIIGFIILIILLIIYFCTLIYMKNRNTYSNQKNKKRNKEWHIINQKIQKISESKAKRKILKFISYIFFLIVFFHQYITEYYFFGFLGHILYLFGLFNDKTNSRVVEINEYFSNTFFSPWILIPINLIVILIVNTLLIFFMLLNINKCLFLQNGLAFTANNLFLSIKIIYFNFSPFFGIILVLSKKIRETFSIVISSIILFLFIFNNLISARKFSAYENKLTRTCIFIESLGFVSSIFELIIFIFEINEDSLIFILIKYILIISNTFALTFIILYNSRKIAANLFAKEMFCNNNYRNVKLNDIYYYINAYLSYSQNKKSNYIKIFKIIKLHTAICNRKECPGRKLITRHMLDSPFTEFTKDDFEENLENNNEEENFINSLISEEKKIKLELNFNINAGDDLCSSIVSPNVNSVNKNRSSEFFDFNNDLEKNIKTVSRHISGKSFINDNDTPLKNSNTDSMSNKITGKDTNLLESPSPNNYERASVFSINERKSEFGLKGGIWNPSSKELMKSNRKEKKSENEKQICGEHHHQNNDQRKLKDSQLQIIGEQEILNRMNYLYKRKNFKLLEEYVFVHLQYLLMVKQNYKMVLYFVGKYAKCGIKFGFLSQYFLYEIKKYVIKSFFSGNNILIKDSYVKNYRREHIYLKGFCKYITTIRIMKQILDTSCENILKFFTFRKELHNQILIRKYYKTKINPILKSANELKIQLKKLNHTMKIYTNVNKQKIPSLEISYLISNFYRLINNGEIPQFILKYINPVIKFKRLQFEQLENEYQLYFMSNPLILALTKKDTFSINYFSNILCEKLGFTPNELKYQDFHDKLFPSNPEMSKEHTLLMKQFIFCERISYKKDETFMKNKDGYLVRINMNSRLFPNCAKEFFIISNIVLLNDSLLITDIGKEKESENKQNDIYSNNILNNTQNNKNNKQYSFLLNENFDFMGITENFYNEFEFNQMMLAELKINFCRFFCIDVNKLINQIKHERHTNIKIKNYKETKINLSEGNCVHSIFKTIPYENMFVLRDSKLFDLFLYPKFFIVDKIDKKKLVKAIPNLMTIIDENGLDYKWYEKLQKYKNRLVYSKKENLCNDQNTQSNFSTLSPGQRSYNSSYTQNYTNSEAIKKNYIRFLSEKETDYSHHLIDKSNQYFDVIYYVNKLGKTVYYIVNLFEKKSEENISLNSHRYLRLDKSKDKLLKNINKSLNDDSERKSNKSLTYVNKNNAIDINNTEIEIVTQKNNAKRNTVFNMQGDRNRATKLIDASLIMDNTPSNKNLKNININNKIKEQELIYGSSKNIPKGNIRKAFKSFLINIKENLEEENIPLISKDKCSAKIKILQYKIKIIIFIIYFLFFSSLVVSVIKIAFSINGFSTNKNIVEETVYFERLQLDLYAQAILSVIGCLNDKIDLTSDYNIQVGAERQLKYTKMNLRKLEEKLIVLNKNSNKSIKKLLDIYYGSINIEKINNNWSTDNNVKDSLLDEIRYLTYNMKTLANENYNGICNWDIFKFLGSGNELNESIKPNEKPNDFSKMIFYFFSNFIYNYNDKFDQITIENNSILNGIISSYLETIFYLNLLILFIFIALLILFKIKIYFDYLICKYLFMHYFNIGEEEIKFENNILLLKNVINEFNSDNIQNFEIFKSIEFLQNDNTEKNSSPNSSLNNSVKSKKSLQKKLTDQSSINSIIMNGSINNSKSMFLINNNQKSNDASPIEKLNKEKIREDTIENLEQNCKKTLPFSFTFSPYFAFINVLILFIIIIYNCFNINNELNKWDFCVNLSSNILERIPKLMEFVFLSYISVIRGIDKIITGNTWEIHIQNLPSYIKYFYDSSNLIGKDLSEKYFNNSRYAELLIDNYLINENLNKYLYEGGENYYPTIKKWGNLLGESGMFCMQASLGETISSDEKFGVYDFYEQVETYTKLCLEDGEKINDSGIKLEINFILQGLVNEFIEFILTKKINLTLAQNNFYSSTQMKRIIVDMQTPFIFYFDTISYSLMNDIDQNNSDSITGQLIFSAVIILVIIEILITWIFIMNANENNKQKLLFFSEIPKRK